MRNTQTLIDGETASTVYHSGGLESHGLKGLPPQGPGAISDQNHNVVTANTVSPAQ